MSFLDDFLAVLYRSTDDYDLEWLSTARTPSMHRFMGENVYGGRLAYDVETEPGPLDGARAPYDPGGATAPDDWEDS